MTALPSPASAGFHAPRDWPPRLGLAATAAALGGGALWFQDAVDPRLRALAGVVAFLAVAGACSAHLRAVNLRLVVSGLAVQVGLAVLILEVEIAGVRPGHELFAALATVATQFLEFTSAGSQFVFGVLADPEQMAELFPDGFILAFASLPILIFMSAVFMVLYHLGVLQLVVKLMARVMARLMGTSGAESLSAAANVFLGVTEAPIIIRPYIAGMTQSELLALMIGGLATIAGTVMAIYISLGADPVAALTTSVMAAPCGLYLSKILLPETGTPATAGSLQVVVEREHVNVIDALAAGASDGTRLAINVAAVLIAFLAFIAMFDYGLGLISPNLTLAAIFGWLFAPVAALLACHRPMVRPWPICSAPSLPRMSSSRTSSSIRRIWRSCPITPEWWPPSPSRGSPTSGRSASCSAGLVAWRRRVAQTWRGWARWRCSEDFSPR